MPQHDPRFITSSRPVNQRTATRQARGEQPLKPTVRARLESTKARSRFGLPLAEQLGSAAPLPNRVAMSAWAVLGSMVCAVSVIGLFLAWLQLSWLFAGAGLLGLAAGTGLVVRDRLARAPTGLAMPIQPLLDAASLQNFDRLLDKIAAEVPEIVAAQLGDTKQLIVRICRQASRLSADENFTVADRMYVVESVRRYLPDSLQSYLLIPPEQRTVVGIDGQHTAAMVLGQQLTLIQTELKKCELKLTQAAAEDLLRQKRFLESKQS